MLAGDREDGPMQVADKAPVDGVDKIPNRYLQDHVLRSISH